MKLSLESTAGAELRVSAVGDLRRGRHESTEPLRALVGSFSARTVWLNLRGVTSFDASGIAWLAASRMAIENARGQLVLLCVPAPLRRALCLLGLHKLSQCAAPAGARRSRTEQECDR